MGVQACASSATLTRTRHRFSPLSFRLMSFEGAVLGMGNPLLDISAHVPMEFVEKCVALAGIVWLARNRAYLFFIGCRAGMAWQ